MANSKHLVAFIFQHENFIRESDMALPYEQLFAKAKAQGVVILPDDRGGPTLCGITMNTYNNYCRKNDMPQVNIETFIQMGAEDWLNVFKALFWDKCKGDLIEDQAVADMIVDWCWTSGTWAIRRVQEMVGVFVDGIIGNKTITALNAKAKKERFMEHLLAERCSYYIDIVKRDPSQAKFKDGWVNRAFDCWRWK